MATHEPDLCATRKKIIANWQRETDITPRSIRRTMERNRDGKGEFIVTGFNQQKLQCYSVTNGSERKKTGGGWQAYPGEGAQHRGRGHGEACGHPPSTLKD
jgi:hypothetical protein